MLSIVLDEAVLNTPDYAVARAFIRREYFVKAVISLPRDAFKDLAKTTAKTSILVLHRKPEPNVEQREPVFYARAESIGPSGRDVRRSNDLIAIAKAYAAWSRPLIDEGTRRKSVAEIPFCDDIMYQLAVDTAPAIMADMLSAPGDRLDEPFRVKERLVRAMQEPVELRDLAALVAKGRTPPDRAVHDVATISRSDATVRYKATESLSYSSTQLQTLKEGDVVISGIDFVNGAIGVVPPNCDGMVVSKEFYILRPNAEYDAHWLVAMLRSPKMRRIIEGTITGTSNRTRVESADVLMSLPVPKPPSKEDRRVIADTLRRAHASTREASRLMSEVAKQTG